jgi:2-polyprenyl-6-methoxyphenol hydroxylase-like FAD-dependent oxidoreductase
MMSIDARNPNERNMTSITASTGSHQQDILDVIIVGAGATGLVLACDLARRGLRFQILDKATEPFAGSRGKGIQPRTLEVLDDLGVVDAVLAAGGPYPRMKAHVWGLGPTWRMHSHHAPTSDVPYPNILLLPQWRTEEILREQLGKLGASVRYDAEVTDVAQDVSLVKLQVRRGDQVEALAARYVVGADGGRSFMRKALGVDFDGTTTKEGRMVVGDLHVDGLSHDHWHVWPFAKGGAIALCPLPNSELFQLMMTLRLDEEVPELTEAGVQARWQTATGLKRIRLHTPQWLSLFRPNVRMVDRYRVGRILLAGDAAHVHTPAGAQGLNTGIQDAYNLGWKLGLVVDGADEALLDSYASERMPVAAAVLGLSSRLYAGYQGKSIPKLKRGDAERQLLLNYRSSSLAMTVASTDRNPQAGDRAPDARIERNGQPCRLFDLFRGPHFSLLAWGDAAIAATADLGNEHIRVWMAARARREPAASLINDAKGEMGMAYGVVEGENTVVLVRPDGYIGLIATERWAESIAEYWRDRVWKSDAGVHRAS